MAIYVKDPKALFIHIPKTGGESITLYLERNLPTERWQGKHSRACHHDIDDDVFVFTCVRNPYHRVLSGYFYMLRRGRNPKMTLEQFIFDYDMKDYVAHPQWEWVKDARVDHIARLEDIKNTFRPVKKKLGCDRNLPHKNKNGAKKDYSTLLTTEMKKKILTIHEIDFEKFNYDKLI